MPVIGRQTNVHVFSKFFLISADFVWSDEWSEYKNHTYKYFEDETMTAVRAEQECQKLGTLLVSINDAEEADFIVNSVVRKRTLSAFIGASDVETGAVYTYNFGEQKTKTKLSFYLSCVIYLHKTADNKLTVYGIMGNIFPRGGHYGCYTEYIMGH